MANDFIPGQKLTAKDLNTAFDSVRGPMNPSNDYQWTQTPIGKLQTTWDTFIQSQNQNPETLEVGIGYSKIGSETVVPIDGKTPAALRRVFVNVGKLRERYSTFGRTFYECPNIGDTNGIPLIGIVGLSYHEADGYYMTGDGKLHFSVWSPFLSQGETPAQWQNQQKLWQDDVARGSDSRGWWWSGITLENFTPEYVTTPQSPDAEGLDLCCFPLYIHYSKPNATWSSETYAVLCVMLKKDMPSIYGLEDPQLESQFFTALQQAYPISQGSQPLTVSRLFLGGQPSDVVCLAQYVYSGKTQNAYYKTNLNYAHFENDISPLHFSGWQPLSFVDYYVAANSVTYELQWIDEDGKHRSDAGTHTLGILNADGSLSPPGQDTNHFALACGYNPKWSKPVLSAVKFETEKVFSSGDPAQCILSGLFNESYEGGLSSETQKRLIYMNTMNARGVEYYETCPDFRKGGDGGKINLSAWTGTRYDYANEVTEIILSSRADARVESDIIDLSGGKCVVCQGVYYV